MFRVRALVEVFDLLDSGKVPIAVIPIENSLAGSVTEHLDLLLARDVFIQRDFHLRIVHNLIAPRGVKKSDLRRVFSHPVALDQCRDFFRANPKIQPNPFYDTAGAVKHVIAEKMPDAAGIASRHAASVYKGRILAAGIEDDKRNFTRFVLLRRRRRVLPGANKTSIAFGSEKHTRRAAQSAARLCRSRHQLEQNRIPPHSRTPLGIRLLRGFSARRR